jgi:ubiquinone/menaquinone biosynthesis C-methylase UbiE
MTHPPANIVAPRGNAPLQKSLLAEFMAQAPYQPATNYWRAVEIAEVVAYGLPQGHGLDLGCGDGHLMGILLSHVGPRDLTGTDIDPSETAMAAHTKIYRELVIAAGDRIGLTDNHFDFVFSNSVLEHIGDIDATLREVARLLRPGGRFIFTVPGPDFHACLGGPAFGSRDAYLRTVDARCAHLRYWSADQWAEHLQSAGLTIAHHHAYLTRAQTQRWETLARYTSGVLYSLAGQRKQPIAIQRDLRIRSTRVRLPKFMASAIAAVIGAGARDQTPPHGCLLIEARKPT